MGFFVQSLKSEFEKSKCGFRHFPADEFVKSQWQNRTQNIIYLIYRWIVALFFIGVIAYLWSQNSGSKSWGYWFIYLTDWGVVLCVITQLWGAAIVTRWHFQPNFSDKVQQSNIMPKSFQIYWLLHNTTLAISIVITLIYWLVLYSKGDAIGPGNALAHITNSVWMFIDVLIVAYPIRILHCIQPVIFGFIYFIFSLIYYACGGVDPYGRPYIYPVLNWAKPGQAIGTSIGCFALAIVIHLVIYLIYNIRMNIFGKFCKSKSASSTLNEPVVDNQSGEDNKGFAI